MPWWDVTQLVAWAVNWIGRAAWVVDRFGLSTTVIHVSWVLGLKATTMESRESRENGCRSGFALLIPRQSEPASANRLPVDVSREAPQEKKTSRIGAGISSFLALLASRLARVGSVGPAPRWLGIPDPCPENNFGRAAVERQVQYAATPRSILNTTSATSRRFLSVPRHAHRRDSKVLELVERLQGGHGALAGHLSPRQGRLSKLSFRVHHQACAACTAQEHLNRVVGEDSKCRGAMEAAGGRDQGGEPA